MKLHGDLVMELPEFVPKSFCDHIINKFELHAIENPGVDNNNVSRFLEISGPEKWRSEDKDIRSFVKKAVNLYTKYIEEEYNFDQNTGTFQSLVEWIKQEGLHDGGFIIQKRCEGFKGDWYCHDNRDPYNYIFGIIYLNTLEPSDDGTTEFLNGRKVKPECGKIMIGPANWGYACRENVVNSGYRYSIIFKSYLNSYPPSDVI